MTIDAFDGELNMQDFDSDVLKVQKVPFIVEVRDTLCYKVHMEMSSAEEEGYNLLRYFEMIEVSVKQNTAPDKIKYIGYKCLNFSATCSLFIIEGDGYTLYFEPYDWHYERQVNIDNNIVSLDDDPATGYEAWEIYSAYKKYSNNSHTEQVIEYLETNQISVDYLKKNFPVLVESYETSNSIDKKLVSRLKQAMVKSTLSGKKINRVSNQTRIKDIDLFMSYQYILKNGLKKNQAQARKEAIYLFYADIGDDEFFKKDRAFEEKIRKIAKEGSINEYLNYKNNDKEMTSKIDGIRHHFETLESKNTFDNGPDDDFSLIMQMIEDKCFR